MRHISECVGEVLAELADREAAMAAARAALRGAASEEGA